MELIEQYSEEDEDVTVLAGPKDALRSQQAHNFGNVQQTKGVRELLEEIKRLKQNL